MRNTVRWLWLLALTGAACKNGAVLVSGPGVAFSPASVSFGSVVVGSTSATSNVQLTNSGTSTLNITSITLTGTDATQFALVVPTSGSPACSFGASTINAGSSCFFGVKFAPTSTGAKSASVSLVDDAAGSPQTVPLSGNGVSGTSSPLPQSPLPQRNWTLLRVD